MKGKDFQIFRPGCYELINFHSFNNSYFGLRSLSYKFCRTALQKGIKNSMPLLKANSFHVYTSSPLADLLVYCEKLQLKRYAMATLTTRDFRAIISYNFPRGLRQQDCFKEMSELFSEDCPSVRTVERWYLQLW